MLGRSRRGSLAVVGAVSDELALADRERDVLDGELPLGEQFVVVGEPDLVEGDERRGHLISSRP